jgi:cytoskeletal protein CcmA (bactofilin family)
MAFFDKRSPTSSTGGRQPPTPQRQPKPLVPPGPPSEFLRETEVRTSIAADAVINGKLCFTTPTRVEGKLKGELRCTQLLIIARSAVVEGRVIADELRVEGVVKGEVDDTRKVEVCEEGTLIGRIAARHLVVREGAFVDGRCAVGTETASRPAAAREAKR